MPHGGRRRTDPRPRTLYMGEHGHDTGGCHDRGRRGRRLDLPDIGKSDRASGVQVILSGGAQAKNIFWQVAGQVTLGTTSHFEGIVLCQTQIAMKTSSTMNGRLLAQSQVTLDKAPLRSLPSKSKNIAKK
jgi:hypothetical protein